MGFHFATASFGWLTVDIDGKRPTIIVNAIKKRNGASCACDRRRGGLFLFLPMGFELYVNVSLLALTFGLAMPSFFSCEFVNNQKM